jgi:uncharacterized protein
MGSVLPVSESESQLPSTPKAEREALAEFDEAGPFVAPMSLRQHAAACQQNLESLSSASSKSFLDWLYIVKFHFVSSRGLLESTSPTKASEPSKMASNPFLLAADNDPRLLPLLRAHPSLASSQDDHGYSVMHAAASYNHIDLLRTLVNEFHVNVDLVDEDGETALFVAETVDCAKFLVEELHADLTIRNEEGKTAREKVVEEGDFPEVAVYLRMKELEAQVNGLRSEAGTNGVHAPPPLPEGVSVNIGSMAPEEVGEVVDPVFRQRIEELAAREDFQSEEGQRQLRELVTEALRGEVNERDVRQRTS